MCVCVFLCVCASVLLPSCVWKLDNIMVAEDGRLALNDFGTAKEVDARGVFTTVEPLAGNPEHMAPEVVRTQYRLRERPGAAMQFPLDAQSAW